MSAELVVSGGVVAGIAVSGIAVSGMAVSATSISAIFTGTGLLLVTGVGALITIWLLGVVVCDVAQAHSANAAIAVTAARGKYVI